MVSVESYVRDTCNECCMLIEMGNRVFECKACYPTWWRCSECLQAEAAAPSVPSTGQELADKRAKRQRQKEERSPEKQAEIYKNKMMREYSFYLRVAYATTMKCPIEYYSAPDKMWPPPEPGSPYS